MLLLTFVFLSKTILIIWVVCLCLFHKLIYICFHFSRASWETASHAFVTFHFDYYNSLFAVLPAYTNCPLRFVQNYVTGYGLRATGYGLRATSYGLLGARLLYYYNNSLSITPFLRDYY